MHKKVYPVVVNYETSIEEMIKSGGYVGILDILPVAAEFIVPAYWSPAPVEKKEIATIDMELIDLGRIVFPMEVTERLRQMGYRPAELQELLAFGEQYPKILEECSIAAFGSTCQIPNLGNFYIAMSPIRSGIELLLQHKNEEGCPRCLFAAVANHH